MVRIVEKTFVICRNEMPIMVVVGSLEDAEKKKRDLRNERLNRDSYDDEKMWNWCVYEVPNTGLECRACSCQE